MLTENKIKEVVLDYYGSDSVYSVEEAVELEVGEHNSGRFRCHYTDRRKMRTVVGAGSIYIKEDAVIINGYEIKVS